MLPPPTAVSEYSLDADINGGTITVYSRRRKKKKNQASSWLDLADGELMQAYDKNSAVG